jgi:integrase
MGMTNTGAKQASPRDKDYKLSDEKGLYLLVKKNGRKYWRMKYRYASKEKLLSIGVYPEVSLKEARQKRDDARKLLADHIDPSDNKQNLKRSRHEAAANSFEIIALEWFTKEKPIWSPAHIKKQIWLLEKNLFPYIGSEPISNITPPILLAALRKIESRGANETARRARQVASQVFRYAVATGRAEHDPSPDLKGALQTPKTKHFAAITDPKKIGPLLLALEGYEGTQTVRAALQIAPMVFTRPGELRQMEWDEIDWDQAEWRIPEHKMKMKQAHIVPLCRQAIEVLEEQHLFTGRWQYVFPSERSKQRPMSENAINGALRRLGLSKEEMTGHGFRAMARTLLDEVLEFPHHLIEHQLAHEVRDPLGRAYNRTTHLKQRRDMMQKWADYLDSLKAQAKGNNVITGTFKR